MRQVRLAPLVPCTEPQLAKEPDRITTTTMIVISMHPRDDFSRWQAEAEDG